MPKIVNSNPFGKLVVDKLAEFEAKAGVHLPNDYKDFLLQYNGGKPIPSFFWIISREDGSSVYQFYGLYSESNPISINTFKGDVNYGIPDSMLPIGDDGTGNFICIGISAENIGNIYFLDHDKHSYHNPNSLDGTTKLADSFNDFLFSLTESPE